MVLRSEAAAGHAIHAMLQRLYKPLNRSGPAPGRRRETLHTLSTRAARWLPFAFAAMLLHAALMESQTLGVAAPMSGDCATTAAGAVTCRKTNGTAFAASATTGTTNASNITSGTLPVMQLPAVPASRLTGLSPSATADAMLGTVIYEKSFWSDLSDFTVMGTAPTITNGKIVWTAANNGTFVNSIALTGTGNNDDEVDMEVTVSLGSGTWNTGAAPSNYGLGIGKLATNTINAWGASLFYNTFGTSPALQFFTVNGAGGANAFAQQNAGTVTAAGSAATAGELLTLVFSQRGSRFYSFVRDVTQGIRVARNDEFALGTCSTQFPNSDRMALWNNGGSFTIQGIRVISRKRRGAALAIVGDSKAFGCNAAARELRFGSQMSALGPVSVYAGSGDTTQSVLSDLGYILAAKPKAVLLNIGRNDLANGVPAATWQANYSSIVSQLKSAGVTVVHLLPIPETAQDQTALRSYITTTFAGDAMIDAATGWNSGTMLAPDGIHPTAAGHAYLASLILASGALPATAGAAYQPPLASSVLFPTQ